MNEVDTAIILAGGLGTRLRPLTNDCPKPLLPLHGKPIMQHTIENLKKHGVKNIILSIGYQSEKVEEYFGDGSRLGVKISYCVEDEPLGTGGAIKQAATGINSPLFVVWGDNLMDINYSSLHEQYQKYRTPVTMVLTAREDVENFGVAKLDGEKIISFVEKPKRENAPSNFINAGAIILDPSCLDMLPDGKSSIEYDLYEKLDDITAFIHDGQWFPTDTVEKYSKACQNFVSEINYQGKKVFIADVDETICETCQEISLPMAEQINKMIAAGDTWAFISGTKCEDLLKMISSKLGGHHLLGTTGTKYLVVNGNSIKEIYNHNFSQEEKNEITSAMEKVIDHFEIISMTTKEDQLQDRDSQITLSAIGRNAPISLKKSYDPNGEKRKVWVKYMKQFLSDDYNIKIGGTTSIDVTRSGRDKEWGIREFAKVNGFDLNQIVFFGDKIYPGGNDYPASKIVDCVSVKNPADTLCVLKKISKSRNIITDVRPWGKFEQYTHNELSTVKILTVEKRLSLQSHRNREETWVALDNGVIAEVAGEKKYLKKGEFIVIPKNTKHRLSSESGQVRVLEISHGEFDENDIIRYEDDFGRA